ncbi:MAG: primosomal protein N' [Pseudomonadota bacterium]
MKILRVALDVPLPALFDYLAQDASETDIGARVLVTFGRRKAVGIIAAVGDRSNIPAARLKPALQILRDVPPLSHDILQLLRFCSDYYHHPLGEVIFNALPLRLRQAENAARALPLAYRLTAAGRSLCADDLPPRAAVKRKLLAALGKSGALPRAELSGISSSAGKAVREMIAQGWVEETREPWTPPRVPAARAAESAARPSLTPEQEQAVSALLAQPQGFRPWLLLGITGSGKTEVYLRAVEAALQRGGQVLVLVPEINLTPQLESRFRERFPGACLASLHSGLNDGERLRNWLLAQAGRADIVLGTRLAVFTPMPRLALIVVDEEHDSSFKQQEGLRYSARDMAVARAKLADVPAVLGSATPSLESYHNALTGRYGLLRLTRRAVENAALPEIRCIDIRRQLLDEGLAPPLVEALGACLQHGGQSLVFINRRGYAPVLMCHQCGWLSACTRCATRLVVHLRERRLRCHHCGHEERIPAACPGCGNADLTPMGQGTQRVEAALAARFPTARILRIDRDSTRRKNALADLLREAHEEQVDILVGTQILAKGHDFKRLALVGVIGADNALYSPDFRASERLFAQLMQVSGRAGRAGGKGKVLIQTEFPDHPLFHALRRHDYEAFAEALLTEREQAGFPPFCHQALLRAEAPELERALRFLRQAAQAAAKLDFPVEVYDPVTASMARLAGKERAQLLVQSASRGAMQAFLGQWHEALQQMKARDVRWTLDVDPLEF